MFLRSRTSRAVALALVLLGALLLRLDSWPAVFPPGGPVRFVSPDCEYHMIRVSRSLLGLPIRVFDPDLNFPDGGVAIWPPLFDHGAALLVRAVRAVAPTRSPEGIAAFWPVLLGLAFPFLVWAVARRLFSRRWAVVAAAWGAGVPAFLLYSQVGHLDQHVAEGMLTAAALAATVAAVRRRGAPPDLRLLAVAGTVCGLLVLTWQGGIFLPPVLFAGLLLAAAVRRQRPDPLEAAALFAPGTILATLGTAAILRGEPPVPFTFVSVSWFQPSFLALAWCGAAVTGLRPAARGRSLAALAAALAAGALALGLSGHEMVPRLVDSVSHFAQRASSGHLERGGYIRYPAAWLGVIGEDRPLWPFGELLRQGSRLFTWPGLVALPIAFLLLARRAVARRHAPSAILLASFAVHVVLALSQRRYAFYLALFVALAVPMVTRELFLRLLPRGRATRSLPLVATLLLLGFAFPFWRTLDTTVGQPGGDGARFLAAVAKEIPKPPRNAEGRAAWGLVGPWSFGHTILRWTGVPVAADNFGYGFEDQARLWLARSEEEAMSILRRRRIRFVLTTRLEPILPLYARVLGLPAPDDASFGYRLHRGELDRETFRPIVDSLSGDKRPDGRIVPRYRLFEIPPPSPAFAFPPDSGENRAP